jgi:hypothetical protein
MPKKKKKIQKIQKKTHHTRDLIKWGKKKKSKIKSKKTK